MTHSYVRHDQCIPVTWLIHMCDMTHSYVWRDTFRHVTWLIHMRDMTHAYMRHYPCIRAMWHVHICDIAHSYVWRDTFTCVTRLARASHWWWAANCCTEIVAHKEFRKKLSCNNFSKVSIIAILDSTCSSNLTCENFYLGLMPFSPSARHEYMYSCTYVRMNVCMYVCIYVCMYVCLFVCIHVCMYVISSRRTLH